MDAPHRMGGVRQQHGEPQVTGRLLTAAGAGLITAGTCQVAGASTLTTILVATGIALAAAARKDQP